VLLVRQLSILRAEQQLLLLSLLHPMLPAATITHENIKCRYVSQRVRCSR
jgi:hypothetical protein